VPNSVEQHGAESLSGHHQSVDQQERGQAQATEDIGPVAEEIRKLADRTAGSAMQIQTLIVDVRDAVNTTVMATEVAVSAVDAGIRRVNDATISFRRIAELVSTTNDASQEIELSTKQQTSAVEQVNAAASDTARETEASAVQTKQTAAHLSALSGDLQKLIGAAAR
jgi:methyl-accepting chemotaxis protein